MINKKDVVRPLNLTIKSSSKMEKNNLNLSQTALTGNIIPLSSLTSNFNVRSYHFCHNFLPEDYNLDLYDRDPENNGPEFKGTEPEGRGDYPEKKTVDPEDSGVEPYDWEDDEEDEDN